MIRARIRIATIAALVGGAAALCGAGCGGGDGALRKADRCRVRGDDARAIELYERAGRSDDAEVGGRALHAAAELLRAAGDDEGAEQRCAEVLERFAGSTHAGACQRLLGESREASGDLRGAIAAYRAFVDADPDPALDEEIRHRIALCFVQLDDPGQALIEWTELLERYPDGARAADALIGVARSQDVAGDCELAAAVYRRVQGRFPGTTAEAEAMVGEAGCLEASGALDDAEALYLRSLTRHPNPAMVRERIESLDRTRQARMPPAL